MIIPTEQLLNIPGIRVLSVRVEAHSIKSEIESTKSGRRAIRRWIAAVRKSGLDRFDTFLTTLERGSPR